MLTAELEETRASWKELRDRRPTAAAKSFPTLSSTLLGCAPSSKGLLLIMSTGAASPIFPSLQERNNFWTGPGLLRKCGRLRGSFQLPLLGNLCERQHNCPTPRSGLYGKLAARMGRRAKRPLVKAVQEQAVSEDCWLQQGEEATRRACSSDPCRSAWGMGRAAHVLARLDIFPLSRSHGKKPMPGLAEDVLNAGLEVLPLGYYRNPRFIGLLRSTLPLCSNMEATY